MKRTNSLIAAVVCITSIACIVAVVGGLARNHHGPSNDEPASGDSVRSLSEADRKYIWEIESIAFQLNQKVAPIFCAAVERADRAELIQFFGDDYQGQIFADDAESFSREFGEFRFQVKSKHRTHSVGREEFVDWLLGHIQQFGVVRQAQLSVIDLKPVEADQLDGAWTGTLLLRVYGELGRGGRSEPAETAQTTRPLFPSTRPTEGGPLGELVIRGQFGWNQTPSQFEQARHWIMRWDIERSVESYATHRLMDDVTVLSGIDVGMLRDNWKHHRGDFAVTSGGVYACDYNNDGNTDLLITDSGNAHLYAGLGGGKFEDATFAAGLQWESVPRIMAVLADFDNDGDEDLILGDSVFENRDGVFVKRGLLGLGTQPVGGAVADYDRDGLVDIYFSYAAPGPSSHSGRTSWIDDQSGDPNRLFRNRGNFQFEDVTEFAHASAGHRSTFTSVWLDADDDGWPDIYVVNELGSNILLHNEHNGKFRECVIGPEFDGFTMGVVAGDLDADGRVDLYLANMYSKAGHRIIANIPPHAYPADVRDKIRRFVSGNMLLRNCGGLEFEEVDAGVSAVGWAYGPALPDLDGDGLLDIHSTCGFASFSRDEPDG